MIRRWIFDVAAMCALVVVAMLPLWSVFGDAWFWVTAGGAILVGAALAVVGAVRRWSLLVLSAAVVAAYFVVGSGLAFPSRALWGVLPTLDTLVALATGVVRVWKEAVTLPPPFAGVETMNLVPLLLGLLVSVVAVSVALRARRFALALIAPGVLLVTAIALSTFDSLAPAAIGGAFGVIALAWSVWRAAGTPPRTTRMPWRPPPRDRRRSRSWRRSRSPRSSSAREPWGLSRRPLPRSEIARWCATTSFPLSSCTTTPRR